MDLGNGTTECEFCIGFMTPAVGLLSIAAAGTRPSVPLHRFGSSSPNTGGGAVACPDLCGKAFPNNSVEAV